MPKLTDIKTRKAIISFFQNHNTAQTTEHFSRSKQTILRYVKQYDGTDQSLIDKRKLRRSTSYSLEEEALLKKSLEKHNAPDRKRNVITPSYTEIYANYSQFKGKRSYAAVSKKARRLIGVCQRGRTGKRVLVEHKRYHGAKEPGTVQVDKQYVPYECFKEIADSPEHLENGKRQIFAEEKRICLETIAFYKTQAVQSDVMQKCILHYVRMHSKAVSGFAHKSWLPRRARMR